MTTRWICTNGHSHREQPSRPFCPVCAAALAPLVPVGVPTNADDGPATLVPAAVPSVPLSSPASPFQFPPDWAESSGEDTLNPDTSPPSPGTEGPGGRATVPTPDVHQAHTLVPPNSPPSAGPAQVLPGYEVMGVLGRGGMGVVYKARQLGLNRVVALKMILSGGHASDEEMTRFRVEAESVAQLQHPNIVQVHEMGVQDGRPYFSLEFCAGGSLQARLDGTPMRPAAAATLIRTLAGAVAYAHDKGIVHRDLKPANILLVEGKDEPLERCTPKITDFGLAKRLKEDQSQTATEAILGTPTYMAPEQAQGKTRQAGPPADVYALGAVLYDLLTGRPPFKGATALDTLQMVQTQEPVPPARLQPGVPTDLQTICLKCLHKDPRRRYATAHDLAADLTRFLDGQPIQARPVSAGERAWKFARRNPALTALLAVLLLAPAAGLTMVTIHNSQLRHERDRARAAEKEKEEQRDRAVKAEQEARTAEKARAAELVRARAAEKEAREAHEESDKNVHGAQQAAQRLLDQTRKGLRTLAGSEPLRLKLLQDALEMFELFTARHGNSAASLLRAADAHRLSGEVAGQLGQYAKALSHLDRALACYDEVLRPGSKQWPRADLHDKVLEVCLQRWNVLETTDRGRAGAALDLAEARLRAMPATVRDDWAIRCKHAALLTNRAIYLQNGGRVAEAERSLNEAQAELDVLAQRPEVRGQPHQLRIVRQEQAHLLVNRSAYVTARAASLLPGPDQAARLAAALADSERAVGQIDELLKGREGDAPLQKLMGQALRNQVLALMLRGDVRRAGTMSADAVNRFRSLRQLAPGHIDFRHLLAAALADQGLYALRIKRPGDGRAPLEEAVTLLKALAEEHPDAGELRRDLAQARTTLGMVFLALDQPGDALPLLVSADAAFRALGGDDLKAERRGAWQNLLVCRDRLAREAFRHGDRAATLNHLAALADLRRRELATLPAVPDDYARLADRLIAATHLLHTLHARARLLAEAGDHRGLSDAIAEMTRLAAPSWRGHLEGLTALARAVRQVRFSPLPADERSALVKRYTAQAAGLLRGLTGTPALTAAAAAGELEALRDLPELASQLSSLPRKR